MTKLIIKRKNDIEQTVFLNDNEFKLWVKLLPGNNNFTPASFIPANEHYIWAEVWVEAIDEVLKLRGLKFNNQIDKLLK